MLSKRVKNIFFTVAVLVVIGGGGVLYSISGQMSLQSLQLQQKAPPATTATATPRPTSASVLGATTTTPTISYDKLYALINGYRRDNKLTALKAHWALEQSAVAKLNDMKQNHYWTHKDQQGRESWYLLDQVGYHFEAAGENLSFGYTTEWKVFEEWTKSPEHNAQLLNPEYEHMGLAVDCDSYVQPEKKTCIVVLHLGKQKL